MSGYAAQTVPRGSEHPNPTFGTWVRSTPYGAITQIFAVLGFFGSGIYYLAYHFYQSELEITPEHLLRVNPLLQIPLILAAVLFFAYKLDSDDEGFTRTGFLWDRLFRHGLTWEQVTADDGQLGWVAIARRSVRSIKVYFLFFLVAMLLYYVWTFITGGQQAQSAGITYVDYVLNVLGGMALLCCFLQLWSPRVPLWPLWSNPFGLICAIVTTVLVVLPLVIFGSFMEAPRGYTGITWRNYLIILSWFAGLLNALVMMLLIARLDSKLIGLRSLLVGTLYAYAAVQTLFAVFPTDDGSNDLVKALTLYAALFLKIYFFFIIHFAFSQGRIFCYMVCAPIFREARDQRRELEKMVRQRAMAVRWVRLKRRFYEGNIAAYWLKNINSRHLPHAMILLTWSLFVFTYWLLFADLSSGSDTANALELVNVGNAGLLIGALIVFGPMRWGQCLGHLRLFSIRAYARWRALYSTATPWSDAAAEKKRDRNKVYKDGLRDSIGSFRDWFACFLGALLVYYLSELCSDVGDVQGANGIVSIPNAVQAMFSIVLNNLSGLFVFCCFLELSHPRTCLRYSKDRKRYRRFAMMTFFGVTTVQAILIISWAQLNPLFTGDIISQVLFWRMISGLAVSLAFALFIARFESVLMWQNTAEVRCLLLYAALQPLIVIFGIGTGMYVQLKVITLVLALILKAWMIAVVLRAMDRGDLSAYLLSFPELDRLANRVFRHGFLARLTRHPSGHNELEIYDNGELVFSSILHVGDNNFIPLLESIKQEGIRREQYLPEQLNGNWRISLVKNEHVLLAGRRDFTDREYAERFADRAAESMDMIKATFK